MSGEQAPRSLDNFGDLLTEAEASEVLRISRMTLYRMRRDGRISTAKHSGRKVLYRKSDLRRLIEGDDHDDQP